MVSWRSLKQEVDECWKKIAVKIEEDVLKMYAKERRADEEGGALGVENCVEEQEISASKME